MIVRANLIKPVSKLEPLIDENNELIDRIGLTFIEDDIFRSIELNDYGTLDYYPEDFIEPSNTEIRAIVKAQMKKRRRNG